ncbi:MAG TPA: alpha/beta hydrolase [Streptosporangiaceae bacterium]|nr:alpha/beta hydrolase [Streptosporangiaceae bacterium]
MRRPLAVLPAIVMAGVLLIAGCSSSSSRPAAAKTSGVAGSSGPAATAAPASPAGTAPTTIAGYYAQKLNWQPCDHGFQCARLLVPFDYTRPAWRRFSLPVIKLPATDPARRIGSLVVNPGGPGASGVQYAQAARSEVSAAVRARFDVVGFDPRGVGGSVPAVQCLSGPQLDKYFATDDEPVTKAQLATVVAQSKLFARGCEQHSRALLPYVNTPDAARDMDVLRAALGDAKLTYLGKSYGTYLGTWYAQLFPSHVRALVLDGAVSPEATSLSLDTVQAQGFEVALRSFTADCVRRPSCPLGRGSVNAGIARLQGLLNRTTSKPLTSMIAGQSANSAMLLGGVAFALYSKSFWKYLREGLTAAFAGNGTLMVVLADSLVERGPNGHYSNLDDALMAVDCTDRPWPRSLAVWSSAAAAAEKAAPQFGASNVWGSLPCAYWPVPAVRQMPLRAAGAPPILVVGTTRDPATPFRWAQALAHDLKSGVLLGWNGDGHTAYEMGSTCVNTAVDRYLISLATPRSGTICP